MYSTDVHIRILADATMVKGDYVWILHDSEYESICGQTVAATVTARQSVSVGLLIG